MNYLSVCDGIGAAHVAWPGWNCVGASEIAAFPIEVVKHRRPDIQHLGDMTRYHEWNIEAPDLICGGTPCQSFSVAGLRKGMDDPRGNLSLVFLGIVDHFRPRWVVWENVPGVLSSNQGRDFGAFLGGLGQLGYGFAYRVLDAQYFGLAQRRKRVFVVGHLGDWRRAAAVLFEQHSLQGHPPPSRRKRERITPAVTACATGGGGPRGDFHYDGGLVEISNALTDRPDRGGGNSEGQRLIPMVMSTGQGNAEVVSDGSPSLTCNHEAPILMRMREGKEGGGKGPLVSSDQSLTLATANDQVLAFDERQITSKTNRSRVEAGMPSPTINAAGSMTAATGMHVRRLTPEECEVLQGFPRGYTNVPWRGKDHAPDGPRYKALGNSWAVPVVRWIGERIELVNETQQQRA